VTARRAFAATELGSPPLDTRRKRNTIALCYLVGVCLTLAYGILLMFVLGFVYSWWGAAAIHHPGGHPHRRRGHGSTTVDSDSSQPTG
jgi:hypothetical protein